MSVAPERRFSGSRPCPVCGGHPGKPAGQGERCYGFASGDGEWAHCTREEHAGGLEAHPNSGTYAHKLTGDCRCGERHDPEPADVVNIRDRSSRSKTPRAPRKLGRLVETYEIKYVGGALAALHERYEDDEGQKDFLWRRYPGQKKPSLEGLPLASLPPYGSELVAGWPQSAAVVLVEGEKAADALRGAGIRALGTVCGAKSTHGVEVLEVLRDRPAVLWPDNDGEGRSHMERHAARLAGIAADVRRYEWVDAPHKGDAADHPAVVARDREGLAGLRAELAKAPAWGPEKEAGGRRPPQHFNLTDLGNAERFVARHGEDVRYVYPWGKWLVWTGARWERDEAGRVHRLAKETVRSIYGEAVAAEDEDRRKALAKHAAASEAEARIKAMLELSKSEVPVSPDELDAGPWLLNAPNGTVDLRTGALRPHRREDLLTKMAPVEYDQDAPAPAWAAFLGRVLPGEELRRFVQRAAGYSATGDTSEQVMFINHGAGQNGKSTFQEALADALGDYAMRTPTEMLLAKRAGGIPNDVARLKGARFVAASETEQGRRLAESLVKDLTGQDTISARFMRAEFFDFRPTHKLWLSTNHKPEIRGTDNAIWRRIRLIPWAVTIPPAERDRKLPGKLRDELPGILAWAVRGCLEWRREGLGEPEEVKAATAGYRAEMDVLAAFFEARCVLQTNATAPAAALWEAWKDWAGTSGEEAGTQRRFGGSLRERGFESFSYSSGSNKGRKGWRGIGLVAPDPDDERSTPVDDPPNTTGSNHDQTTNAGDDEGLLGKRTVDLRLPEENPKNKPDSTDVERRSRPSRPESSMNDNNSTHVDVMPEKGLPSSTSSTSSTSAADDQLAAFLEDPPDWFLKQAAICVREGSPTRLLNPLANAVSTSIYGSPHRWREVLPGVEARLGEGV